MMMLIREDGTKIQSFGSYRELCQYVTEIENEKLFEDHPQFEFGQPQWHFTVYTPDQIARLFIEREKQYDEMAMMEAFKRKLCLLQVCKGDYKKLTHIILTPDIDLEAARRKWLDLYIQERSLVLVFDEEGK